MAKHLSDRIFRFDQFHQYILSKSIIFQNIQRIVCPFLSVKENRKRSVFGRYLAFPLQVCYFLSKSNRLLLFEGVYDQQHETMFFHHYTSLEPLPFSSFRSKSDQFGRNHG
jgi:hypothetical protein